MKRKCSLTAVPSKALESLSTSPKDPVWFGMVLGKQGHLDVISTRIKRELIITTWMVVLDFGSQVVRLLSASPKDPAWSRMVLGRFECTSNTQKRLARNT